MPLVLKGDSIFVFPFRFLANREELFIREMENNYFVSVPKGLTFSNHLKILKINDVQTSDWIKKVIKEDGPFMGDKDFMVSNLLYLYHFWQGETKFEGLDTITKKAFEFTIERKPILKSLYQTTKSKNGPIANTQLSTHFPYLKYYEANNDVIEKFLMTAQKGDTIIFDFRGYPKNDLLTSTRLMFGTNPRKVAYSLMKDDKTGCFEIREEETYFSNKNELKRMEIEKKQLVIIGIIGNETGSYVETAVMGCKTYHSNFIIVGQPSIGALGTISTYEMSDLGEISYPYHKFYFFKSEQINSNSQILPDIHLNSNEIDKLIKYGLMKKGS